MFHLPLFALLMSAVLLIGNPIVSISSMNMTAAPALLDQKKSEETYTVAFVGDTLFDRHIRKQASFFGTHHILNGIGRHLEQYDTVIANLEGPITDHPSISIDSRIGSPENFRFTNPPYTAEQLSANNISIVSLANNHIGDFGRDGIQQTQRYLEQADVAYFGTNDFPVYTIPETTAGTLSFVGFNPLYGESVSEVVRRVRNLSFSSDHVFVYAHWGEEYETEHTEQQQRAAYAFIDAGADAVLGAHPHVIQPVEIYNGSPIYYSLGNFVFDQYSRAGTQTGLIAAITLNRDEIVAREHVRTHTCFSGRTVLLASQKGDNDVCK